MPIQKKPHWLRLGPGLSLGYRRNAGAGTWSIRAADGRGDEWLKKFAIADDYEPADGKRVLNYSQAIEARADSSCAATFRTRARRRPSRPRSRLTATTSRRAAPTRTTPVGRSSTCRRRCSTKPVTLIDAHEWRKWRDSLIADLTPGRRQSGDRRGLRGAAIWPPLTIRASPAIGPGRSACRAFPTPTGPATSSCPTTRSEQLVDAAYAAGDRFGLFVETLATTGARPSQASRIEVGDLRLDNPAEPKLMVPRSAKGGGRLTRQAQGRAGQRADHRRPGGSIEDRGCRSAS